jgi:hypothetical protein
MVPQPVASFELAGLLFYSQPYSRMNWSTLRSDNWPKRHCNAALTRGKVDVPERIGLHCQIYAFCLWPGYGTLAV